MKRMSKVLSILLALLMLLSVTAFAAGGEGGGNNPLTLVSATVGDVDLNGAKIPAGSEITLTFSNNVTDATVLAGNIGKIKVKDAAGAEASATVSAGEDKTVFIVTLGDLSKGDYTLTLGKELTAKNGSTLGEKVEIAFTVNKGSGGGNGGGNNPLEIVSVTANGEPLANAALEASGEIVITFSRGMTDNQAANIEQIGIYSFEGDKMEGLVFTDFAKDDNGDSFTVLTYSDLPAGDYTLRLGKDLKANNGNTLGEDCEFDFSVIGDEPEEEPSFFQKLVNTIKSLIQSIIDFFRGLFN